MRYVTHTAGGLSAGLLLNHFVLHTSFLSSHPFLSDPKYSVLFIAASVFGSVWVDLDTNQSLIGSKLKPISSLFVHRGIFHTPFLHTFLLGLLAVLSSSFLSGENLWLLYILIGGLGTGILSHLILDSLTKMGIMWFYPLSKKYFSIYLTRWHFVEPTICSLILAGTGLYLLNIQFHLEQLFFHG